MSKCLFTLAVTVLAMFGAGSALADSNAQHLNSGTVIPSGLAVSEIVVAKDMVFISGMIGVKPLSLDLAEGGIVPETRQTMQNVKMMLEAHGFSLRNITKCNVYLADLSEYQAFNAAYGEFFEEGKYPARTVVGGNKIVADGRLEMDCIGVK
ncbi:MAG: RidA family protein [Pseudomonadota bacterium]